MTASGPSAGGFAAERRERARLDRRRTRRRRVAGGIVGLVLAAVVFFAGLALGRALEETPPPGGTQSLVRTLAPATLPPVPRTVTVTNPEP